MNSIDCTYYVIFKKFIKKKNINKLSIFNESKDY